MCYFPTIASRSKFIRMKTYLLCSSYYYLSGEEKFSYLKIYEYYFDKTVVLAICFNCYFFFEIRMVYNWLQWKKIG